MPWPKGRKNPALKEAQYGNQNSLGYRHTAEAKAKMRVAAAHRWRGRKHTPATKEKMRQAARARQLLSPVSLATREKMRLARLRHSFPQKMTSIERSLQHEFKKRRLKFEMHKTMFGRFQPDFVFEGVHLIVQADGDYWHRILKSERDGRFNQMAHGAGWTVWRFAESEIKEHPAACGRAVARFVRSH